MPSTSFGSLTQLNAIGGIEKYLIDSPSLTFWRFQHLKYTNFSVDHVQLPLSLGSSKANVEIDRQGDLINKMYLQMDLAGLDADHHYVDSIGQMIIKDCVMNIGGQCVSQFNGAYMYCWEELSGKEGKLVREMTGKYSDADTLKEWSNTARRVYVPLPFWFCESSGSALPLIALQFHRVQVKFTWETDLTKLITAGAKISQLPGDHVNGAEIAADAQQAPSKLSDLVSNINLLVSYVYLSQEERQRFADGSFEFLITQVQPQEIPDPAKQNQINFNHSAMELIWAVQNPSTDPATNKAEPFGGHQTGKIEHDTVESIALKFNNHDRVDPDQPGAYYRLVQPYNHHSRIPQQKVYCFSFGLHPEEPQPSGAVNMSRIDKITFSAKTSANNSADSTFYLWARNYNVLKIENGLGGQMYAS